MSHAFLCLCVCVCVLFPFHLFCALGHFARLRRHGACIFLSARARRFSIAATAAAAAALVANFISERLTKLCRASPSGVVLASDLLCVCARA